MAIPADKIELYDKLVAMFPDVERKGKANPYTSYQGNMFSCLSKDGVLGIRLSKEDGEAFCAKYESGPFIHYGAVMKGYVTVPDELFANLRSMKKHFQASITHVESLPSKATSKKTTAKKKTKAKKKTTAKKTTKAKKKTTAKKKTKAKKKTTAKKKTKAKKS